jgi:hypothetical protein
MCSMYEEKIHEYIINLIKIRCLLYLGVFFSGNTLTSNNILFRIMSDKKSLKIPMG